MGFAVIKELRNMEQGTLSRGVDFVMTGPKRHMIGITE
jgi:hypothetical protein